MAEANVPRSTSVSRFHSWRARLRKCPANCTRVSASDQPFHTAARCKEGNQSSNGTPPGSPSKGSTGGALPRLTFPGSVGVGLDVGGVARASFGIGLSRTTTGDADPGRPPPSNSATLLVSRSISASFPSKVSSHSLSCMQFTRHSS